MSIAHLLEVFEETSKAELGHNVDEERADHELAVFERGYKAGWDDSNLAAERSGKLADEEFMQSLRELSFTYQEARSAILAGLEPCVSGLIEALLPTLETNGLASLISSKVGQIALMAADGPVLISCHPTRHPQLSSALGGDIALPVEIVSDPLAAENCVSLRAGRRELEIDLDNYAAELRAIVAEFFARRQEGTNP